VDDLESEFILNDRYYTRDHMWVRFEEPLVRMGITSVAQHAVGNVVFIDVPKVGLELKIGEAFSWIESSKVVIDLFPPLSGSVTHTNVALESAPEVINREPYGAGWICMFEPRERAKPGVLLDAQQYATLVEETG
jgi:glycine cleavage system H protein